MPRETGGEGVQVTAHSPKLRHWPSGSHIQDPNRPVSSFISCRPLHTRTQHRHDTLPMNPHKMPPIESPTCQTGPTQVPTRPIYPTCPSAAEAPTTPTGIQLQRLRQWQRGGRLCRSSTCGDCPGKCPAGTHIAPSAFAEGLTTQNDGAQATERHAVIRAKCCLHPNAAQGSRRWHTHTPTYTETETVRVACAAHTIRSRTSEAPTRAHTHCTATAERLPIGPRCAAAARCRP